MIKERKGSLFKKAMAVLLSAALFAGMLEGITPLSVFAADGVIRDFASLKSAVEGASGSRTFTIGADIQMTGTITVPAGSVVTLKSDGNHTLKRASSYGDMFCVNGALKIGDEGGQSGSLTLDGGAVWYGSDNEILGRGTSNRGVSAGGSLICGNENSSIYLYRGAILQNNRSADGNCGGAATLVQSSRLYINDGSVIRNNYSSGGGGAVKVWYGSSIIMSGGEIYGCQANTHGGAFQVFGQKQSSSLYEMSHCSISGGVIRNNLCNRYGGAIAVSNYSGMELSGNAKIAGNRTTSTGTYPGGGIAFADNDTSLSVSGTVVISENTRGDGQSDNLHIGTYNCNKITLGNLSEGARIGITMKSAGVFTGSAGEDYQTHFFSDDSGYSINRQDGNALVLVRGQTYPVHSCSAMGSSLKFRRLPETAGGALPAGNYYLDRNVELTSAFIINGTVNLCLNGYQIRQTTDGQRLVTVENGGRLNLCDCNGSNGVHTITSPVTGGSVEISGGLLTGGRSSGLGGAVMIDTGGAFYMHGGTLAANTSRGSGGHGGGVRAEGLFCMYGGKISHNKTGCGGGLCICDGETRISGGEISYNESTDDGGGVFFESGGPAVFSMSGGSIVNNKAVSCGGGVHYYTGVMEVSGSAVIRDNTTVNNGTDNVYMDSGRVLSTGTFSSGAQIGVSTQTTPTETSAVPVTDAGSRDNSGYFFADNEECRIFNENNTVKLGIQDTTAPTGEIRIDSNHWNGFLNTITFGIFFKETKNVVIMAEDTGSGVDSVSYYVSETPLPIDRVEAIDNWTEGAAFNIEPDKTCVVYARLEDKQGNIAYISSDGLVFDKTPPAIQGVTEGETYCISKEVTVKDDHLDRVMVNGAEVSLTGDKYEVIGAEGIQTIEAVDRAGNRTTVSVTVNESHDYTEQKHDAAGHWQECQCGDKTSVEEHGFGDWVTDREATESEEGTKHRDCGVCGYREEGTIPKKEETHVHDYNIQKYNETSHWQECECGDKTSVEEHGFGDWVTDREATESEEGTKHRDCGVCGYREEGTIPKKEETHVHDYNIQKYNETSHWQECECGDKTSVEEHGFGDWVTDREATESEEGTKHRDCGVCGYRENETIPKIETGNNPGEDDNPGVNENPKEIHGEVEKSGNAPDMALAMTSEELADIILTETERNQLESGVGIRIILQVKDAEDTVSDGDKMAVTAALQGFSVGQYLDVSLYKLIGESRSDIHETEKKLMITIAIPETLKNGDGGKTRTFAVIRVHNGQAERLQDMDSNEDTITIATDRFSTYVIVYQDIVKEGGSLENPGGNGGNAAGAGGAAGTGEENKKGGQTKDGEPKTGYRSPIELYATLSMIAGFGYLLLYFSSENSGMTEEKKKELVSKLAEWGKRGGKLRRLTALTVIFVLLVYYHGIGKKNALKWKKLCER